VRLFCDNKQSACAGATPSVQLLRVPTLWGTNRNLKVVYLVKPLPNLGAKVIGHPYLSFSHA
jgi:hypothetical protein